MLNCSVTMSTLGVLTSVCIVGCTAATRDDWRVGCAELSLLACRECTIRDSLQSSSFLCESV